jgi:hypothetical protein
VTTLPTKIDHGKHTREPSNAAHPSAGTRRSASDRMASPRQARSEVYDTGEVEWEGDAGW